MKRILPFVLLLALGVARALGWEVTGVEVDEAAAEKAKRFTSEMATLVSKETHAC